MKKTFYLKETIKGKKCEKTEKIYCIGNNVSIMHYAFYKKFKVCVAAKNLNSFEEYDFDLISEDDKELDISILNNENIEKINLTTFICDFLGFRNIVVDLIDESMDDYIKEHAISNVRKLNLTKRK